MTDLSIIILNYNTSNWLENALRSLQNFPSQKYEQEIIVVDNASTDDSVEMVKQKFSKVKLIQSPENGGFSKGNNLGIKQAKGRYIMLLNSDAEFTAQTQIDKIVTYLDENPKVAVVTPKLVLNDGSIDLASHRGEPTPLAALTYFSGLEKLFPQSTIFAQYHQSWKNFDTVHEIDACSGAAMIVRTEAIHKVGLLDESFFMYAEDLDWCKRFRDQGYQIIFFPDSTVIHHKYKSGQEKETQNSTALPVDQFLQIPGFTRKKPTKNSARFHFFETMKQYYTKHYQTSSPIQTWIVHQTVNILRFFKS